MTFNFPHFPAAHLNIIRELPDGHCSIKAFDRLRRTPAAEEIMAKGPPEGLVRVTEEELRAILIRAIDNIERLASIDSFMDLTFSLCTDGNIPRVVRDVHCVEVAMPWKVL